MTGTDVEVYDNFDRRVAVARARTTDLDTRDPRAATVPVGWVTPNMPMRIDWDARTAVNEAYLANVVAYRCVQIIANTLAVLPFRAGPDPDKPQAWDRRAPLARLLGPAPGGPAPKLSARKLWAWTVAQRLVTGRNAWELELAPRTNQIVALWPLVSADLDAVPTMSGAEWFSQFRYGPRHDPVVLTPERVFYGWWPHPNNFRQPLSPLEAAKYDLTIARMADRYGVSFLRNGAVPAAVVVTGAFADRRDRNRFRQQWTSRHSGPDNAGRVAFAEIEPGSDLGQSFAVQTLGLTQKDAQLLEQHREAIQHVAIDLGVPWSKLDASGRTFDNARAEEETFWENTMLPLIRDLEDEVNMELAPRVGSDAGWFDLSGVKALKTKAEPVTAAVGVPALVQAQVMTIDEGRAEYGLAPLPGGAGDRLMTVEEIQALRGGGPSQVEVVRTPPAPEVRQPEPTPTSSPPPVEEVRVVDDPEQIEARRARIWSRTDAQARQLEARWERAFGRLFGRQEAAALKRLEGNRGRRVVAGTRAPADEVFDREFWEAETADVSRDLFDQVAVAATTDLAATLGLNFDVYDPLVGDFVEARANQLAGQVTDTTYRQITETLAEGAAEGDSIPDLADRIRAVFAEARGNRATVIARTEVVSAFNGAAVAQASTLPADVVAAQEWIATRDGRTRPAHASADGQIVAVGAAFEVGGDMLGYPGDPSGRAANTVQCRCAVAFLTPDDMPDVGRSSGRVELRRAVAALRLVAPGEFDARVWRAVLEVPDAA